MALARRNSNLDQTVEMHNGGAANFAAAFYGLEDQSIYNTGRVVFSRSLGEEFYVAVPVPSRKTGKPNS